MSADSCSCDIVLSPAYRLAIRALAQWLEQATTPPHHHRFALRKALTALDPGEHTQLVRWLGWWCVAAQSHNDRRPLARLRALDATLAHRAAAAMPSLYAEQPRTTRQKSA